MHQAVWLRLWAPLKGLQPRDISARFCLKMAALSLCVAGLAACGDDSHHAVAASEPTREAAISDAEAVTLSKVALATLPQLPVNIQQHDSLYNNAHNSTDATSSDTAGRPDLLFNANTGLDGPNAGRDVFKAGNTTSVSQSGNTDGIKVISWETPGDNAIQNCAAGGTVNIQREPKRVSDSDTSATIETAVTLEFIDCATQRGGATRAQDGTLAIHTSTEANKQSHAASADVLANFNAYSLREFDNGASQTFWVDGEFGVTALQHSSNGLTATTTMLAASGAVNKPDGSPATRVTFRDFGVVFEHSQQQQLLYMMGDVDATIGGESFRYTLSTIEPMGTANGVIQGRFLVESGLSKVFIDRISADEVTISVDRDGDGTIDYANNIESPMMTAFPKLSVSP
ncbi:MAG TPA: hypothetical protein VIC26_13230 [Marinagarivorans sp.]